MILTIDIGGTKTLIALFSDNGEIKKQIKFATSQNPSEFLDQLLLEISNMTAETTEQIMCISIAVPGPVEDGKTLWYGNLDWSDTDIREELEKRFSGVLVIAENDANLAGLSEAHALDSHPKIALYLTISTGIGGGVVADGRIDAGMRRSEVGHMPLRYGNETKEWEDIASGEAIFKRFGKYISDITDEEDLREIADRIGYGISLLIAAIQPDVVIIGGGAGGHLDKISAELNNVIDELLPSSVARPPIIKAQRPSEAVIYGCYLNAVDRLSQE
jgi:Transcriptional regulator/sugar kinase